MKEIRDADAFLNDIYKFIPNAPTQEDYRKASIAFFELRRAQDTGKNDLFDLGAGLLSVGSLALLMTVLFVASNSVRRFVTHTHGISVVIGICVLLAVMTSTFVCFSFILDFDRFEYPPWADSMGLPLASILPLGVATFVFFAAVSGVPHLVRRLEGVSFVAVRSPAGLGTILAWLIYGPLALGFHLLSIVTVGDPVGWLSSPTMVIAAWLMLHARAVTTG